MANHSSRETDVRRVYIGRRSSLSPHIPVVTVNGVPLLIRRDINSRSNGLEWGYGGAGPAQLAVALLADAFGAEMAQKWAYLLEEKVTKKLPREGWMLTEHCLITALSDNLEAFRDLLPLTKK